jgi:hypothetical protein
MLTLTPTASAAVATLLHAPDTPEGASLRLQRGLDTEGEATIGLAIVTSPESDDEPVVAGEDDVFLAPDVVDLLDDQVLDAEIHDRGVAFMIRPQGINGQEQ